MGKTSNLFKKTGDTKGKFLASLGVIKEGNIHDQTEEEIKKRWKDYTRELYKKGLSDLDNHNGVVASLEPTILEYEGKWALGNITTNKASVGDGIPAELFKILKKKMMLIKSCTQYVSKFGKLNSGHRTGKGQFPFQSQEGRDQRMF